MRIGLCCEWHEAHGAVRAGFDYVELPAVKLAEAGSDVPVEATNVFFPGDIKLVGPAPSDWKEYAKGTIFRAAQAGVQVMVVGSGASRTAPEAFPREEAERQFVRVCSDLQEIANPYGILIAPESLNASETNVGNSLPALQRALRSAGVGYTVDSYHVLAETCGSPDWSEQIPELPAHIHISNAHREPPTPDDPQLRAMFDRLRELGYEGRVSLEARRQGRELAEVVTNLRALVSL